MIMEAMRLSMADENERIRRQQEQERQAAAANGSANTAEESNAAPPTPSSVVSSSSSKSQQQQQQPQMSSSYRPPAGERLHDQAPQLSSSLPSSPLTLPNASSSLAPSSHSNHHSPSMHQPPPSPSALGGASASLVLALGAPAAQSQSGLAREGPDGSRSYPPLGGQMNALSAMLGATSTAAAVLGGRHSPSPEQLAIERPRSPAPFPVLRVQAQAQVPPDNSVRESSESSSHDHDPVPQLHAPVPIRVFAPDTNASPRTHHSPAGSGAATPIRTAASTPAPASSPQLPSMSSVVQSGNVAETPPLAQRTLTQQSQTSLLTRGSANSETTEEYDVLLSSSHSSDDESELIARAPLIQEGQDESADGDLQEEQRNEGPSKDDEVESGEPLPVSNEAGVTTN